MEDDGSPISNNGTTTLVVYLTDSNDNPPLFDERKSILQ